MMQQEKNKDLITLYNRETFPDICVCCGNPVPEGTMVCWDCTHPRPKGTH